MRYKLLLFLLLPLSGFAQKISKANRLAMAPGNCIQLDSTTFIGQTEITNVMYREFVEFVRDSIVTHLLYNSLEEDLAWKLLDVSQRELKRVTPQNVNNYKLNYDAYKSYEMLSEPDVNGVLRDNYIYYPESERFYHRREMDPRKFIYKLNENESIAVYPDTASWETDYYVKYDSITYPWASAFVNMYFWHPAYNNYPVVGLNLDQILAYCHWYERQLNENAKNPAIHYSVSTPTLSDYTAAAKLCVPAILKPQIGPEYLTNPIAFTRGEQESVTHVHKAYLDMSASVGLKTPADYVMQEWVKTNSTSPILNLLGGPAEVVQSAENADSMTILGGDYYLGIVDPNGIQVNTLFHERSLPKENGYSFVGFRILVKTATKL